jgi:hypothetical protein
METRLTLRPGQAGTKKFVEAAPWKPGARRARRCDEDIVAVRIAWHETDLRERAMRLGAIWRPVQKIWEMR